MIQVSQDFITAVNQPSRQWRARLLYNNVDTGATIKSIIVKGGSMDETTFNLCGVYSGSFEAMIDTLNGFSWEDKEIQVQYGLVLDSTTAPETIEWVTVGTYYVTEVEGAKYTTRIIGNGTLSVKCGIAFTSPIEAVPSVPQTIANVITAVQNQANVTISVDSDFVLTGEIEKAMTNITCLEALQIVASVLGGFVCERNDGVILVKKYGTAYTYETSTERMIAEPTFSDIDNEITGVSVMVKEASIDADGNPVPAEVYSTSPIENANTSFYNEYMTQTLFTDFESNLVGLSWRKAEVPITLGDPRLEAQDIVKVTVGSDTYNVPCHSYMHTFDGGLQTRIISLGDSEALAESQQTGLITRQIKSITADILQVKDIIAESISIGGHFFVGSDGFVHITEVENDYTSGNNIIVDNDSVEVRDGTTSIASFGSTTRIGENNKSRVEIGSSKISLYSDNNEETMRLASQQSINIPASKEEPIGLALQVTSYTYTSSAFDHTPVWSSGVKIRILYSLKRSPSPLTFWSDTQTLTFTSTSSTASATFTNANTGDVLANVSGSIVSGNKIKLSFTSMSTMGSETSINGVISYYYAGQHSQIRLASDPPSLQFYNATGGGTSFIRAFNGGANGNNLVFNSGGNVFIGGGEYANNRYAFDLGENTQENAYFGSDGALYLESNGNTIANRKTWELTTGGNFVPWATRQGIYGRDKVGNTYPYARDNGTNLWIGAEQTTATHHWGSTFISSGYNGANGNASIYISVPNTTNSNATNYLVYHEGNIWNSNVYYEGQASSSSTSLPDSTVTKVALSGLYSGGNTNNKYFEISGGGIKVKIAGRYRVSASAYISGAGSSHGVYVYCGTGTTIATSTEIMSNLVSTTVTGGISVAPKIVEAYANNIFLLGARSIGAAGTCTKNLATYLLVERVGDTQGVG